MMEHLFNFTSMLTSAVIGTLAYVFGGWDELLKVLLVLIVLDYLTGVLKALYNKELSSVKGYNGIVKKVILMMVVAMSVMIQKVMGNTLPIREVVITFFIANESLSLIENASSVIPVPESLKKLLLQLKSDTISKKISDEKEKGE